MVPSLQASDLAGLSDADLLKLGGDLLHLQQQDRQFNQLRYYKAANDKAALVHTSTAKTLGIGGGNGAGKTDHALAELVIRATGQLPLSLRDTYPRAKLRGPIQCRVVCESLTTTLVPVILPKLQWWRWSGVGRQGSDQGHWGWIPKHCLIGGEWKPSWTERLRILRLFYRDTDNPDRIVGESTIQFMSYDQDASDFASGDFHFVLHDEPPKYEIWSENRARVMRVDGTLMLSMTWPSDASIPIDWLFDEVYDRAQPGHGKDPNIDWVNIFSTENPHLNQAAVAERAGQMGEAERAVRIFGQPLRFSNRVHPLFTDAPRWWCAMCKKDVIVDGGRCCTCGSAHVFSYCHVEPVVGHREWPVLFGLDPHPRKPHMMLWCQVTPADDLQCIHEASVPGGPDDVMKTVRETEGLYGWDTIRRLIDPNMGRSPSGSKREVTWQDEFEQVGLPCDLADDSDVGRSRFNDYLRPDGNTRRPRWLVDPRCTQTILQLKRYVWDDYKRGSDYDQKQKAKAKYDDYPTLLKYMLNSDPSFRGLRSIGKVFRRLGQRGENGY